MKHFCVNLVIASLAMVLVGCPSADTAKEEKKTGSRSNAPAGSAVGGVMGRAMNVPEAKNHLGSIRTAYQGYRAETGKSPSKLGDIEDYLKADTKLMNLINDGHYVIVWDAEPTAETIVAYEKEPDIHGGRQALLGSFAVEVLSQEKFDAALKAAKD